MNHLNFDYVQRVLFGNILYIITAAWYPSHNTFFIASAVFATRMK